MCIDTAAAVNAIEHNTKEKDKKKKSLPFILIDSFISTGAAAADDVAYISCVCVGRTHCVVFLYSPV